MKSSFVSEALIVAGSYLCVCHSLSFGLPMVILGCLSGLANFLYFVSLNQISENRKNQIYVDIMTFFKNVGKAIHEAGIVFGVENEKNRNKTVH